MEGHLNQSRLQYFSTLLWPFLLSLFVGAVAFQLIGVLLAPLEFAFGNGSALPAADNGKLPMWISSVGLGVAVTFVLAFAFLFRNAWVSNSAIKRCDSNGTVRLSPDFDLMLTRYFYSKVSADLSRTDFSEYSIEDFPLSQIHRLTELRIEQTSIPDWLVDELVKCTSLQKVDFAQSSISSAAIERLADLRGIAFAIDGLEERQDTP